MEQVIINLIDQIKVNKWGGRYAVYKPLLLLLILHDVSAGKENRFLFKDVYPRLQALMERYGWETASRKKAEYPFYFLASSVLWNINIDSNSLRHPDAPSKSEMDHVEGRLDEKVYNFLKENPTAVTNVEAFIRNKFFTGKEISL